MNNYMELKVLAKSENESFARSTVGAFCVSLSPSIEELNDIKTAVSEAVTNSIVHGYQSKGEGIIKLTAETNEQELIIVVSDNGVGIKNINEAIQPFFTSRPEQERSGMGFTIMQTFMDALEVISDNGTTVIMKKLIKGGKDA
ncbi:MAG: anti-sigma F factor [Clostridia bacterium]